MDDTQHGARLLRSLRDAGCTEEEIRRFLACQRPGERLGILSCRRTERLAALHRIEAQIDCLDFLIYSMKQHI